VLGRRSTTSDREEAEGGRPTDRLATAAARLELRLSTEPAGSLMLTSDIRSRKTLVSVTHERKPPREVAGLRSP